MTGPFDAAAWLDAFERVGGGYVRRADGEILFGWIAHGSPEEAQTEARRLRNQLDTDRALGEAVEAAIAQRDAVLAGAQHSLTRAR